MYSQDPQQAASSRPNPNRTHYGTLKVAPDAPPELIQAAYRSLARLVHPDTNPGNAAAARQMQEINAAYAILGDPPKRAAYDATLAGRCPSAGPERPSHRQPPRASPEFEQTRARAAQAKDTLLSDLMTDVRHFAFRHQRRVRRLEVAKVALQIAFPIGYFGFAEHLMNTRDERTMGWIMMCVGAALAFGCVAALVERLYR